MITGGSNHTWCLIHFLPPCNLFVRLAMLAMSLLSRATFYSFVERHREAIADYTEQVNISETLHGKDSLEVRKLAHVLYVILFFNLLVHSSV